MPNIEKPINLESVIREKVRVIIADLIPTEALDGLIQKEWDSFVREKERGYGQPKDSDLTLMIRAEIVKWSNEKFVPIIRHRLEEIETKSFKVSLDENPEDGEMKTWREVADQSINHLVGKTAKTLLEYLMGDLTKRLFSQIQSALYNMQTDPNNPYGKF